MVTFNVPPRAVSAKRSGLLEENILSQIRTLLVDAGITESMLNLPEGGDTSALLPSYSLSNVSTEGTDISDIIDEEECDASLSGSILQSSLTAPIRHLDNMARRKDRAATILRTKRYFIPGDLYNLFWISAPCSGPFWYAIISMAINFALEILIIVWIFRPGGFQAEKLAKFPPLPVVVVTKFLLIPVAVGITEELMLTMDVTKMRWVKLEDYPHATVMKYWFANTLRLLDGLLWLFICISLMIYATDILEMFLNFAALQFLQYVDNSFFEFARGGYLTDSLEEMAKQVMKITLPSARDTWQDYAGTILLVSILLSACVYCVVENCMLGPKTTTYSPVVTY